MTRRAMAVWILVIAMAVAGPAAAQTTTPHTTRVGNRGPGSDHGRRDQARIGDDHSGRGDRGDRPDRVDRTDRVERVERTDRTERAERIEKPERSGRH